ncbi:MAG: hypothetical protein KAT30_00435 [Candidatus Krumholzibacteria bacterium]|nr:hypothetical protein [Candidatus Krumholzibacteria bacterium]
MLSVAATPSDAKKLGRRKKLLFSLIVAGISAVLAFSIAETFLRIVPIPGAVFHNFYYDDVTGSRSYPHSSWVYRNDRNEYAKRKVNSWGYLDKEHEFEKAPGVTRLGFIGDSFTEARQFPLEDVFHQIIERDVNSVFGAGAVECIAIGTMGHSTFQGYLESQRWADSLGLDQVFYVFSENDLGDNIPLIKRYDAIPYPIISGDTLKFDFSFRERYRYKTGRLHRAWQFLKSRSLVCGALQSRIGLLRRRGIKLRATEADMQMSTVAEEGVIPTTIDVPSSWPDSFRVQAREVTERVIVRWKRDVEATGRDFAIVYIPRDSEVTKPIDSQDS